MPVAHRVSSSVGVLQKRFYSNADLLECLEGISCGNDLLYVGFRGFTVSFTRWLDNKGQVWPVVLPLTILVNNLMLDDLIHPGSQRALKAKVRQVFRDLEHHLLYHIIQKMTGQVVRSGIHAFLYEGVA